MYKTKYRGGYGQRSKKVRDQIKILLFSPCFWHSLGPLVTSEKMVTAKSIQSDRLAPIMKRFYPGGSNFF